MGSQIQSRPKSGVASPRDSVQVSRAQKDTSVLPVLEPEISLPYLPTSSLLLRFGIVLPNSLLEPCVSILMPGVPSPLGLPWRTKWLPHIHHGPLQAILHTLTTITFVKWRSSNQVHLAPLALPIWLFINNQASHLPSFFFFPPVSAFSWYLFPCALVVAKKGVLHGMGLPPFFPLEPFCLWSPSPSGFRSPVSLSIYSASALHRRVS